jgi:hypothetical protein
MRLWIHMLNAASVCYTGALCPEQHLNEQSELNAHINNKY